MAVLTDYLEVETLQPLQNAIVTVAELPIRFCAPDGTPLTAESSLSGAKPRKPARSSAKAGPSKARYDVPILVAEEVVGRILVESDDPTLDGTSAAAGRAASSTRHVRLLGMMAAMVGRLCDREKELRARVRQLATLYRLTAEFTSRRDLTDLLNLVARTVVEVLKAKSCSIRLLSEDRKELVIKAVANLSKEYLSKGPILVSASQIDSEVLAKLQPLYIADERTDLRVMYPAEARREGIVSGLVAPLAYRGRSEGVIRVYTGRPHTFDWFEVSLLEAVAAEAAAAIVNARLYQEALHAANMRRALTLAGEVQRRMIPSEPPSAAGFQVASLYAPSYELGGDFFDFLPLPNENLGLVVCDVVGKGVRASLLMASIRASLRAHAANIYEMSDVLARVNRDLCEDVLTSDFATLFYGVLDVRARRLTYCNAGHPAPILFRGGQVRYLSAGGIVIGVDCDARYAREAIDLKSGDLVLAYTDGLPEALNFRDEPFGIERIERAAQAAIEQGKPAEGMLRHLLWEMRRFAGLQTRFDDLTMLAVRVL